VALALSAFFLFKTPQPDQVDLNKTVVGFESKDEVTRQNALEVLKLPDNITYRAKQKMAKAAPISDLPTGKALTAPV